MHRQQCSSSGASSFVPPLYNKADKAGYILF